MLSREIRDIRSTPGELRKFAWTMAAALAVVGALLLWRQKGFYVYPFGVSGLFVLAGLLMPTVLRPVHKAWMTLALVMGWIMTHLILFTLFYLVLTPTALVMRLLGKDILNTRFGRDSEGSYWIARDDRERQKSDYERQF